MNYKKIYDNLVIKARSEGRVKIKGGIYYEKHHIIPKCMGGSNRKENMVFLLAREHFLAHKLLVEIYPENKKLLHALWMLSNTKFLGRNYLVSSREYERLKTERAILLSLEKRGIPKTEEHNEKNRQAHLGKKRPEHIKEPIRKKLLGRKQSQETREKKRQAKIGVPKTEEHKQNMKKGSKHIKQNTVECPYCHHIGKGPNIYQYHFNKCKLKPIES